MADLEKMLLGVDGLGVAVSLPKAGTEGFVALELSLPLPKVRTLATESLGTGALAEPVSFWGLGTVCGAAFPKGLLAVVVSAAPTSFIMFANVDVDGLVKRLLEAGEVAGAVSFAPVPNEKILLVVGVAKEVVSLLPPPNENGVEVVAGAASLLLLPKENGVAGGAEVVSLLPPPNENGVDVEADILSLLPLPKAKALFGVEAGAQVVSLLPPPNGNGVDVEAEALSLLPLPKAKALFGVAEVTAPVAVFPPDGGGKDELVKRLLGVEGPVLLLLLAPKLGNDWLANMLLDAGDAAGVAFAFVLPKSCAPLPKAPPLGVDG
jgi:hypothetical protein